ncbi:MAG: hypothetical protein JKY65_30470 [Planctomycetes bacterium]|nr:hypothetical protein [Planctomycetota bacterium]
MSGENCTKAGGKGTCCRNSGLGCLGAILLGGFLLGLLSVNASARLDARLTQAKQEISEVRARTDDRRATVLGTPANDDNAVVDYQGLEWVLTAGDEASRRVSWERSRPELPGDVDKVEKQTKPKRKKHSLDNTSRLMEGIFPGTEIDDSPRGRRKLAAAKALFWRVRPALRYVRSGLKRGKCDWGTQLEMGMESEIPNLRPMRAAASLMAYEASLQEPRDAIQTGLEIVAFGTDLGRQGTLIGSMVGQKVSSIGFKSLNHTLARPGLEARDYRRVIEALGTYQVASITDLIAAERLAGVVTVLGLSGRPLSGRLAGSEPREEAVFKFSLFTARELEGYEHFLGRAQEVASLPKTRRPAAWETLTAELSASPYVLVKAIPNLRTLDSNLLESESEARIVRILAAAHLVRLEKGAFPQQSGGPDSRGRRGSPRPLRVERGGVPPLPPGGQPSPLLDGG